MSHDKRVFFGFEVQAPWPMEYPKGRIIGENSRHLTAAFLGNVDYNLVLKTLKSIPLPTFTTGIVGFFDQCLFLPPRDPHVVAWRMDLMDETETFHKFCRSFQEHLNQHGFDLKRHAEFLPHVTVSRSPFEQKEWKKEFSFLPCFVKDFHLYESLGNLQYQALWTHPIHVPFEEIEHTADIAYRIYGNSLTQLYKHALTALSFRFPPFLNYSDYNLSCETLEIIIQHLNDAVTRADSDIGCPFKAISYHGVAAAENNLLVWEMIIDV